MQFRKKIEDAIVALEAESVPIQDALNRVVVEDVFALQSVPAHAESLRDGFVVGQQPVAGNSDPCYRVCGEVAAGDCLPEKALGAGEAWRIFTGALVPASAQAVIPFEKCRLSDDMLYIPAKNGGHDESKHVDFGRRFVRPAGAELEKGDILARKGTRLGLENILRIAGSGGGDVLVGRRPRVNLLCTGNELISPGKGTAPGRKISVNSITLRQAVATNGGVVVNQELVKDDPETITSMFSALLSGEQDVVVTTGGMGPGKYDFVRESFLEAGGIVLFDRLPLRPGKSILIGLLGSQVFIALPGPPNAVRTLANELVGPIVLLLQGARSCWPRKVSARLMHPVQLRSCDVVQVKSCVLTVDGGECRVTLQQDIQDDNAMLGWVVFSTGKRLYEQGDLVDVHLRSTGVCLAS